MAGFTYPDEFKIEDIYYASPSWPGMTQIKTGLELDSSDWVLVGYPKSGTTWVADIMHYLNVGPVAAKARGTASLLELTVYPEVMDPPPDDKPVHRLMAMPHPWRLRTHLYASYYERFLNATPASPTKPGAKFIVLLRNPKDVLNSWYHMHTTLPFGLSHLSWNEFFDLFKQKRLWYGDPIDQNLSWWKYRDDPNVIFIHYEDMLADCAKELHKLCKFLGCSYSAEEIDEIVKGTSFAEMKKKPVSYISKNTDLFEKDAVGPLQRKGIKGDWKTLFTDEQNEYMANLLKTNTDPVGLHFKF